VHKVSVRWIKTTDEQTWITGYDKVRTDTVKKRIESTSEGSTGRQS
jgi:hypothetical protein